MAYTNDFELSLPMQVWLLQDNYDYDPDPNHLSATSLLKPIRQVILARRAKKADKLTDISSLLSSAMGTAIHDSLEKAWTNPQRALKLLGHPDKVTQAIKVNPENPDPNEINVFLEKRTKKQFNDKWSISGKFDMVLEGRLYDFKTTSVYTYLKKTKDKDYQLQGSIYRWLNPELIIVPVININFLFTDWQGSMTRTAGYPQVKAIEYPIPLLSLKETEQYISNRLALIDRYIDADEKDIPFCTDEELWRGPTRYKYFSNAAKTDGRATKAFDNAAEAAAHRAEKGKGVVIEVPGAVKACAYCPAFTVCSQKDLYEHEGI